MVTFRFVIFGQVSASFATLAKISRRKIRLSALITIAYLVSSPRSVVCRPSHLQSFSRNSKSLDLQRTSCGSQQPVILQARELFASHGGGLAVRTACNCYREISRQHKPAKGRKTFRKVMMGSDGLFNEDEVTSHRSSTETRHVHVVLALPRVVKSREHSTPCVR